MKFDYSYQDVVLALKNIGINKGDSVFLHSNLGLFGIPKDVLTANQLNDMFFSALIDVVGIDGTIVTPTFSYSFCKMNSFDSVNTNGDCGLFSEYLRKKSDAKRSLDANFSVAAIGRLSEDFTSNPPEHSFGKDSFWDRFRSHDGKILCLNFPNGSTYIHYVEKNLSVSYRYDKPFHGKIFIDGQFLKDATFFHYVRHIDRPDDEPSCSRLNKMYDERGLLKKAKLGRGVILAYETGSLYDFLSEILEIRPRFLLKTE